MEIGSVIVCKEQDCVKPKKTAGYCNRHYLNYHRHGKPNGKWVKKHQHLSLKEKILLKSKLNPNNGCLEWTGSIDKSTGYGYVIFESEKIGSHRAAFEVFKEQSIEGKQVLHKCDNRKCVNPDHLFLGTIQDNMKDKVSKGRQTRGSTFKTAKVNEKQVLVFRSLKKSGFFNKELASLFQISVRHMARITSGDRWKHVGESL